VSLKRDTKFKISNNIVFRKQPDGNYILLEIDGDLLFKLDEVSAFIWNLLSEGNNFEQILENLNDEYEGFEKDEREDVNSFLSQLIELKIITLL
jgi:chloramphenicol O-acetyltransferase